MQLIKEKLKQIYIPINTGSLALFISLLAVGYVASATNSPCLQAQATCAVGGESEFSGNVGIKGGTTYVATLDASGITADRNIELPDADGELMIGGGLGASKVVATDVSGDLTTTNVYPLSIGTSGQVLTVDATNTFLEYSSITGVPSLTATKSVSTDGAGALTTNDVYPLTLTADKVAKTDSSGNLTTGTVDLDQITTAGASTNDEIRLGAGGSWESFTPSGGGDYTLVASGNVIMNSAFGSLPKEGANICWFTQAGKLDDDKSYRLVVEFDTYSGQLMNTAYQNNAYWNPLFYASSVPDCGDTTNNNNGFNENVWSMTQNMPFQYAPNNVYFSNGYSENSGVTYVDCCVPLYPYGAGQGGITSYVSASNMIMDFSPFQDSVFSSSYKVGFSAQYTVNGYVQTTQLNPTNDIVSAWQIIGNATSLGNTQGGSLQSNDRKFEDFQGLKIGCSAQYCWGGDTTWALYELNR